jgi:hypothetical protein
MKKISLLLILVFVITNISACVGYKPIFSSSELQFRISDFKLEGDQRLDKQIYSKLYSLSKNTNSSKDLRNVFLEIRSSKEKNATAKNTAGKTLEYKISVNIDIFIRDHISKEEIMNQNFSSSTSYKVQDQLSETKKLENKSIEDLIERIFQDILVKLSENIFS